MSSIVRISLDCLYCHQSAERPIGPEPDKQRAGICPECGGAHHVWCWHIHGGCSKPDCLNNPKNRMHGVIPYVPSRVRELPVIPDGPEKPHLQTDRVAALERFETAYETQSHRRIAAAWNEELFNHFQPAEKYRADAAVANHCAQTLDRLVTEYRRQHWQSVVDIYESWNEHLDSCRDYLEGFPNHVQEARSQIALKYKQRIKSALDQDDDEELEKIVSEHVTGSKPGIMPDNSEHEQVLTAEEQRHVMRALERLRTVREIIKHLGQKDSQEEALALYDGKVVELRLMDSKMLTTRDRLVLYEARRTQTRDALRQAIVSRDDNRILATASAALAAGWTLQDTTLELVREAWERKAARARVSQADNQQALLLAYDEELLSGDKLFSPDKREAVESAQRLFKPLLALKRAIKRNDVRTIAAITTNPSEAKELGTHLDLSEKEAVARTQAALQSLHELSETLALRPRTTETLRQIVNLVSVPDIANTCEALMTPYENEEVRKALATFAAVDELGRLVQAPDIPYVKLAIAKTFQKAQHAGVVLPTTMNWNKIRGAVQFAERWTALTRAIEQRDERAIFEAWNPTHLHEALELLSESERQVLRQALQNTRRQERLRNALASNDEQRVAFAKDELFNPSDVQV